ncbi:MAG: hypothetical protein Q8J97_02590, partial [Flavobacteriaceae bacterium]|nr:hypothetical protein [Flavobacteriaceae bacterium]
RQEVLSDAAGDAAGETLLRGAFDVTWPPALSERIIRRLELVTQAAAVEGAASKDAAGAAFVSVDKLAACVVTALDASVCSAAAAGATSDPTSSSSSAATTVIVGAREVASFVDMLSAMRMLWRGETPPWLRDSLVDGGEQTPHTRRHTDAFVTAMVNAFSLMAAGVNSPSPSAAAAPGGPAPSPPPASSRVLSDALLADVRGPDALLMTGLTPAPAGFPLWGFVHLVAHAFAPWPLPQRAVLLQQFVEKNFINGIVRGALEATNGSGARLAEQLVRAQRRLSEAAAELGDLRILPTAAEVEALEAEEAAERKQRLVSRPGRLDADEQQRMFERTAPPHTSEESFIAGCCAYVVTVHAPTMPLNMLIRATLALASGASSSASVLKASLLDPETARAASEGAKKDSERARMQSLAREWAGFVAAKPQLPQ